MLLTTIIATLFTCASLCSATPPKARKYFEDQSPSGNAAGEENELAQAQSFAINTEWTTVGTVAPNAKSVQRHVSSLGHQCPMYANAESPWSRQEDAIIQSLLREDMQMAYSVARDLSMQLKRPIMSVICRSQYLQSLATKSATWEDSEEQEKEEEQEDDVAESAEVHASQSDGQVLKRLRGEDGSTPLQNSMDMNEGPSEDPGTRLEPKARQGVADIRFTAEEDAAIMSALPFHASFADIKSECIELGKELNRTPKAVELRFRLLKFRYRNPQKAAARAATVQEVAAQEASVQDVAAQEVEMQDVAAQEATAETPSTKHVQRRFSAQEDAEILSVLYVDQPNFDIKSKYAHLGEKLNRSFWAIRSRFCLLKKKYVSRQRAASGEGGASHQGPASFEECPAQVIIDLTDN
jgi:hypothetical protein